MSDSDKSIALKKLFKLMRANGVLSLKHDGVEVQLAPQALFPQPKRRKSKSGEPEVNPQAAWMGYSDEQLATWSAPSVPQDESNEAN